MQATTLDRHPSPTWIGAHARALAIPCVCVGALVAAEVFRTPGAWR